MIRARNKPLLINSIRSYSRDSIAKNLAHKYAETLCLPKTSFPNRSGKPEEIKSLTKRVSDDIYEWQV